MVQWLRLQAPNAGLWGEGSEIDPWSRYYIPHASTKDPAATKTWHSQINNKIFKIKSVGSKLITNKDMELYSTGNSTQYHVVAWMGGAFGGEWIHVYVQLKLFTVHLKLPQHC